jgi:hypothetical protein
MLPNQTHTKEEHRMGRPPLGKRAMTAAEKQKRYRAKTFGNSAPVTKPQLKARIAQLEAELEARPPKAAPAPITINADTSTPALKEQPTDCRETPAQKENRRKRELRDAVKEAEKRVQREWRRSGITGSGLLQEALSTARAVAREEIRTQWAREDAEAAAAKIELPAHIVRLG